MLRRRVVPAIIMTGLLGTIGAGAQGERTVREGYVTTSDSARLFYRVMGRGPDTLIAIHGGPGVENRTRLGFGMN